MIVRTTNRSLQQMLGAGHCYQNTAPVNDGYLRPYILCAPSFSAIPAVDRQQSGYAVSASYAPPDTGEQLREDARAAATAPGLPQNTNVNEAQPNQQAAGPQPHAQHAKHAPDPLWQHLCQMLAQSARPAIDEALVPALELIGALQIKHYVSSSHSSCMCRPESIVPMMQIA